MAAAGRRRAVAFAGGSRPLLPSYALSTTSTGGSSASSSLSATTRSVFENEGPRPFFRAKLRRKLEAWKGSALEERLLLLEEPWNRVSLDDPAVREALVAKVAELDLDALLVGPVTRSGMNEAGTLQQVRDYANLLGEIRAASGRRVTFLLAHHENRGGQVSGAWEGAVDTLDAHPLVSL